MVKAVYDAVHDLVDHPMDEVDVDLIQQRFRHRLIIHAVVSAVAVRGGLGGARVVHADSPFAGQNVS